MRETAIGLVTLNSPPLNILTRNVLAVVRRELAALAREPALRVVVLRAEAGTSPRARRWRSTCRRRATR